ncbi:MAG: hypothetical protein AAFU66_07215 [Pseudomonadota bacterium]
MLLPNLFKDRIELTFERMGWRMFRKDLVRMHKSLEPFLNLILLKQ